MKHAAELDPVSPSVQTSLAWGYFLLRRHEAAVEQCKRVLELYPDFVPAHQLLGLVYAQANADQQSMAELKQAETLENDSAITPMLIDYELARSWQTIGSGPGSGRAWSREPTARRCLTTMSRRRGRRPVRMRKRRWLWIAPTRGVLTGLSTCPTIRASTGFAPSRSSRRCSTRSLFHANSYFVTAAVSNRLPRIHSRIVRYCQLSSLPCQRWPPLCVAR